MSSEPEIRWTGDEMARLIWRCLDCGTQGEAESKDGVAEGNRHRATCPALLGLPPPLKDDRVAMMLGLVPDKRTPEERLWDAVRTKGASLEYRYNEQTGTSEYLPGDQP